MFFSLLQNKRDLGWGVAVGLNLDSFIVVFTSQLASKIGIFFLRIMLLHLLCRVRGGYV